QCLPFDYASRCLYTAYRRSPVPLLHRAMINEDTNTNIYKRIQVTGQVDLKLIEGLTWSSNFSYMTDQQTSNSYHSTQSQIVNSHGEATRNTLMGRLRRAWGLSVLCA
ncbi:MAG: hypothetical protein PUF30_08110, partial [bacterium]|nr:hypothetical protein [bacterium]